MQTPSVRSRTLIGHLIGCPYPSKSIERLKKSNETYISYKKNEVTPLGIKSGAQSKIIRRVTTVPWNLVLLLLSILLRGLGVVVGGRSSKHVDRSADWNQYLFCRLLRKILVAVFQWTTKHVDRSADSSQGQPSKTC